MSLIEELKWRGLLHDIMPGTEELLAQERVKAYVGFDPTADSLHIGNLVPIMLLVHWQRAGHIPVALVGGATGMVGDPSGKTAERQFLDVDVLQHNLACQRAQLEKFLDFTGENAAVVVNNYDWFKDFTFLDFIRDVGKHITVNYMLGKDSVKNRLESGMSFTEFTYQLVQGYDFYHLWKEQGVKVQMGGSDQWGNIVTGTELIRRKGGGQAFAVTAPLITKADGSKFGKSEGGNVWLDKNRTSAYKFYQYWINAADEDAARYLRIFTLLSRACRTRMVMVASMCDFNDSRNASSLASKACCMGQNVALSSGVNASSSVMKAMRNASMRSDRGPCSGGGNEGRCAVAISTWVAPKRTRMRASMFGWQRTEGKVRGGKGGRVMEKGDEVQGVRKADSLPASDQPS